MMATSFGTTIPQIATYRVYRTGPLVTVRVWIGDLALEPVGELTMRPSQWQVFRKSLPEYDPSRCSIFYSGDTFEWLHSAAAQAAGGS